MTGSLYEFDKIFNLNMEMLRDSKQIQIAGFHEEESKSLSCDVEKVRSISYQQVLMDFMEPETIEINHKFQG
jgi:hypothetical protein